MSSEDELVQLTKTLLEPVPTLTPKQLYRAMVIILELTASQDIDSLIDTLTLSTHVKIASFLSCLKASRLDHRAEYIAEAAKAVLGFSHVVELDLVEKTHREHREEVVLDIVGTGGDGQNTFNVSTSAAIVAAGIPGLKVCKHGGKASTSNSGSGDLINTLGVQSSKVTAETVPALWDNKFMFLLAPYFHYGFGKTSNLRKLMHIPTIFNILGPLLHPVAHVDKRVLGVYFQGPRTRVRQGSIDSVPKQRDFRGLGPCGPRRSVPHRQDDGLARHHNGTSRYIRARTSNVRTAGAPIGRLQVLRAREKRRDTQR